MIIAMKPPTRGHVVHHKWHFRTILQCDVSTIKETTVMYRHLGEWPRVQTPEWVASRSDTWVSGLAFRPLSEWPRVQTHGWVTSRSDTWVSGLVFRPLGEWPRVQTPGWMASRSAGTITLLPCWRWLCQLYVRSSVQVQRLWVRHTTIPLRIPSNHIVQ